MTKSRALTFATIVLLACKTPEPANSQAPPVAALMPWDSVIAQLGGVRLGMSLSDLHLRRPKVQRAEWVGRKETIGAITVLYYFPEPEPSSIFDQITLTWDEPRSSAPLLAIEVRHVMPSDSAAAVFWHAQAARLNARSDLTDCFIYWTRLPLVGSGLDPGVRTVLMPTGPWRPMIAVRVFPERVHSDVTRRLIRTPATVNTVITSDLSRFIYPALDRRLVDCNAPVTGSGSLDTVRVDSAREE